MDLGDRTLIVTQKNFSAHRLTVNKIIYTPKKWFFEERKKNSRLDLLNCQVNEVITHGVEHIFMKNVRGLTKPKFHNVGTLMLRDNQDMQGIVTTGTKNLQRVDIVGCDGLKLNGEQKACIAALPIQEAWTEYPDYPAFFEVLGLVKASGDYKLG